VLPLYSARPCRLESRQLDRRPPAASSGSSIARQPSSGITVALPDDHPALLPRRNPEDIDLGAIKADLEFLIEQVTRLRKEQALRLLYVMVGSAGIVIAWIELFWRHWIDVRHCF
jgi:hypothetical protein